MVNIYAETFLLFISILGSKGVFITTPKGGAKEVLGWEKGVKILNTKIRIHFSMVTPPPRVGKTPSRLRDPLPLWWHNVAAPRVEGTSNFTKGGGNPGYGRIMEYLGVSEKTPSRKVCTGYIYAPPFKKKQLHTHSLFF